jgi:hypothetical protein
VLLAVVVQFHDNSNFQRNSNMFTSVNLKMTPQGLATGGKSSQSGSDLCRGESPQA